MFYQVIIFSNKNKARPLRSVLRTKGSQSARVKPFPQAYRVSMGKAKRCIPKGRALGWSAWMEDNPFVDLTLWNDVFFF